MGWLLDNQVEQAKAKVDHHVHHPDSCLFQSHGSNSRTLVSNGGMLIKKSHIRCHYLVLEMLNVGA